jgi:aldehyde dehydrogenase (NAD+)
VDVVRSYNPWEPSDLVSEQPRTTEKELNAAVQRCVVGQSAWAEAGPEARSAALFESAARLQSRAAPLADLLTREVGKPVREARAEVARSVAILRYHAQAAMNPEGDQIPTEADGRILYTTRRPRGVVAAITPWNFPLAIPSWKTAPALAAGNAVLLKAAPQAIACAAEWEQAFLHLPAGVVTIVYGEAAEAQHLLNREEVAAVSFTGSGRAGRSVIEAAARRGMAVQAEMGGQNAAIVAPDADLDAAAADIAYASMGYAGQKCTATRRVLVHKDVATEFVDRITGAVATLGVGDPREESNLVGPVISHAALDAMRSAVRAVRTRGGRVVLEYGDLQVPGHLGRPTVIELDDPNDPLAQEELFAPVTTLIRVRDVEHALQIANSTRYGLAASVHTRDIASALRVASSIKAGLIKINQPTSGVDLHAGFGGVGDSSYGPKEQGPHAQGFWTTEHTITFGVA